MDEKKIVTAALQPRPLRGQQWCHLHGQYARAATR